MLLLHLKFAARQIIRHRVFSSINITGLAISLACCVTIIMYVWNETNHDAFHKYRNEIYRVTEKQDQAGTMYDVAVTPGPLAEALRKDFPGIINTVRIGSWSGLIQTAQKTYEENGILLTENSFLQMFDFKLLKGDRSTLLKKPGEIIITASVAEKYFGKQWKEDRNLLNKTFTMNRDQVFKLSGVVSDPPENSSIRFDMLLPLNWLLSTDKWANKWNSNNFHTYVQLHPQANADTIATRILNRLPAYNPETKDQLLLQPLRKQYLYSDFDFNTDWGKRSDIKYVRIFSLIGLVLLIITCVNFVNLSTARAIKRSLEVGVHKVTGASRGQLILQFLAESLIIAGISGLIAALLLQSLQPYLATIAPSINVNAYPKLFYFGALLLLTLFTGLLAGLYPAIAFAAFNPLKAIQKKSVTLKGKLFRQSLVVFQFAASVTLMICTLVMYRQVNFMQSRDLGFDTEQLLNIRLNGDLKTRSVPFRQELETVPGIVAAAPATIALNNVQNSSYFEWDGMNPDEKLLVTHSNADPSFIDVTGMRLIAGNNFSKQYTNDTSNFILNKTAVSKMGLTPSAAIGKTATFFGGKGVIIGVIDDFHYQSLRNTIGPFLLRYQPEDRYYSLLVKLQPGNHAKTIDVISGIYKKYEKEYPFDYKFVSETIAGNYKEEKQTADIILLFANITLFIGCLGLFGLTVISAEQRLREICIRKVLGASLANLATLLSKDYLKLIAVAMLIAIPAGWYLTNTWLENFAYRTRPAIWIFALVALGVFLISAITISLQAIRSGLANPAETLRTQ